MKNLQRKYIIPLFIYGFFYSSSTWAITRCENSFSSKAPEKIIIDVCRQELQGPVSNEMREVILTTLGRVYLAQGETNIALASWNEAGQYNQSQQETAETFERWTHLQGLIAEARAQRGEWSVALQVAQRALSKIETVQGTHSILAGQFQDAVGRFAARERQGDVALDAFQRARIVYEIRLGRNHPKTIETRLNQAIALMDLEETEAAFEQFTQLSNQIEKVPEYEKAPVRAEILTFLGTFEMQKHNLAKAIEHYKAALHIREQAFGNQDLKTSQSLNNLGVALLRAGEFQAAEQTLSRAYDIRKTRLGEKDALTVSVQRNLLAAKNAASGAQMK